MRAAACVLLALATGAAAEPLQIVVTGPDGRPAASAMVVAEAENAAAVVRALTDAQGRVTLDLADGRWVVSAFTVPMRSRHVAVDRPGGAPALPLRLVIDTPQPVGEPVTSDRPPWEADGEPSVDDGLALQVPTAAIRSFKLMSAGANARHGTRCGGIPRILRGPLLAVGRRDVPGRPGRRR